MDVHSAPYSDGNRALTRCRRNARHISHVGQIADFKQDRRRIRRFQDSKARHPVVIPAKRHCRPLAFKQIGKACGRVHRLALRKINEDRRDIGLLVAQVHAVYDVGLVLARRQLRCLPVRCDFGQGVYRRAARLGHRGGIGVDRNEQIGFQPARDFGTLLQDQKTVVLAR